MRNMYVTVSMRVHMYRSVWMCVHIGMHVRICMHSLPHWGGFGDRRHGPHMQPCRGPCKACPQERSWNGPEIQPRHRQPKPWVPDMCPGVFSPEEGESYFITDPHRGGTFCSRKPEGMLVPNLHLGALWAWVAWRQLPEIKVTPWGKSRALGTPGRVIDVGLWLWSSAGPLG